MEKRVPVFLFVSVLFSLMSLHPARVLAMDWETAAAIASCHNKHGYEKAAERAVAVLKENQIYSIIVYFQHIDGMDAVTEDQAHADKCLILVNIKDAFVATRVLKKAIANGLHVVLLSKPQLMDSSHRLARGVIA